MEARSVIEQRMQSLVGAISCVQNVLKQQKGRQSRKKLLSSASSLTTTTSTSSSSEPPTDTSSSSSSTSTAAAAAPTTAPLLALLPPPPPPMAPILNDEAPLNVVGEDTLIKMVWHDKNSLIRSLLEAVEKEEKTYQTQLLLSDNNTEQGGSKHVSSSLIGPKLRRLLGMRSVQEEKQMKQKKKQSKKQTAVESSPALIPMQTPNHGNILQLKLDNMTFGGSSTMVVDDASFSSSSSSGNQFLAGLNGSEQYQPQQQQAPLLPPPPPPPPPQQPEVEAHMKDALAVTDATSCSAALLAVRNLLLEAAFSHSVFK
jgi:hypothetical protein